MGLFGVMLLVLARKERVNPAEEEGEDEEKKETAQK